MANINKIRVSGTTYDIQDINAPKVIELTQAEYDALTVKDPNVFYVITDSEYNFDGYWTSAQTQNAITQSVSNKADTTAVTSVSESLAAHTANTTVHVTAQDKTNWNAKSDFSGNYNDLANKPTIPTSASQLTNDSGYITSSALNGYATEDYVTAATDDMATKTWVGNQGYLTEHQSLSNYYTKSETSGATQISTALASKQSTLESGTNIKTINNESILGSGNIDIQGGSTYTAGRGIDITNDTISFNLPISAGTGTNSIAEGSDTIANGSYSHAEGEGTTAGGYSSHAEGYYTSARGSYSHAEGESTKAYGGYSHAEGQSTTASGSSSHAEGNHTTANGYYSHAEGRYTIANNNYEHASGRYNISNKANDSWGDSGNTLFSVGNGTSTSARHNAFEIRQNGDIYLTKDGQDVKLQDQLGGSSITVDTALDSGSTNPVENRVIYNKIDEVEQVTAAALNNINDRLSEDEEVTAAGLNALNDNFGGLKLVKLTQAEYNALATKDSSTLYIIVN